MLPASDAPKLFMPTFRTYEKDYCDGIAVWWAYYYVCQGFSYIHNPDELFIYFCSANLTYHQGSP
jgi:hypothetical protein